MKLCSYFLRLKINCVRVSSGVGRIRTRTASSSNLESKADAASRTRIPVSRYPITTFAPLIPAFVPTKSNLKVSAMATYDDLSPAFAFCFPVARRSMSYLTSVSTCQRRFNFIKRGCCSYISHILVSSHTMCLSSVSAAVDLADLGWPEQALLLLLVVEFGSSLMCCLHREVHIINRIIAKLILSRQIRCKRCCTLKCCIL